MDLNEFQKLFLSIILGSIMLFLLTAFMLILTSCSQLNDYLGLKDDNIYEEVIEGVIKFETGVDIDLTPSSKEVGHNPTSLNILLSSFRSNFEPRFYLILASF